MFAHHQGDMFILNQQLYLEKYEGFIALYGLQSLLMKDKLNFGSKLMIVCPSMTSGSLVYYLVSKAIHSLLLI